MKTKGLFLSALFMGAILTGCSNEDDVMNNGGENNTKSDSYIAVNIVNPSAASSRAENDANGTDEENEVNNALFVFFNDGGAYIDASEVAANEFEWTEGSGPASKISNAVIVLSNPTAYPTSVLALLNTGLGVNDVKGKSLSEIKAIAEDYSNTDNGFVMSNSVYKDGEKEVIATPLTDSNIQSSEDLAKQNPVTISVERVLAKVTVKEAASLATTGKDGKLDGKDVTLVPEIIGYQLVQTNPKSNLVKNIDGMSNDWNDAANFRSYWAKSYEPESYGYCSFNDIAEASEYLTYCHENTTDKATTLLVAAKIKAEGAEGPVTIIKYKGMYYTEEGLNTYINSQMKDCYYTVDVTDESAKKSNDWSNYIEVVASDAEDAEPWAVMIQLNGYPGNATAEEKAAADAVIEGLDEGMQWTDGSSYFYVEVKHDAETDLSAVIRNHFYQLTINSVEGLGTPVYDPDEVIEIFEKPTDEEYYIAAKIQILKWNIVSQNVALN